MADNKNIPFSTFQGCLKQLNAARLRRSAQASFAYFFSGFLSDEESARWLHESGIDTLITAGHASLAGRGRERRYAGDFTLGRSRYSAVVDEKPHDPGNNQLLGELFAYMSSLVRVVPVLLDTTVDVDQVENLRRVHPELPVAPSLVQVISPHPAGALPLTLGIDASAATLVVYPLEILKVEIERVIDLRSPATAEWFTKQFVRMELDAEPQASQATGIDFAPKKQLAAFSELLPTLLSQARGGGSPFLQGIGAWLRSHGAKGLTYPSARVDSGVEASDGKVVDHWGFAFVDYRDSGPADWNTYFGRLPGWVPQADPDFTITFQHSGPGRGSWRTEGVRAAQSRRFREDRQLFVTLLRRVQDTLKAGQSRLQQKASTLIGLAEYKLLILVRELASCSIGELVAAAMAAPPKTYLEDVIRYDGESWFVHRRGADAEVLIICPVCIQESLWPVLRGYPPVRCPRCRFSNGEAESEEVIRARFLEWAQSD